jgi:hypothetical protein
MEGALLYLTACSVRNRLRVRLRRLREPRYFLATLGGLLYFGMMFRPGGPNSRMFSTWRANGFLELALGGLLFLQTALAWILPGSRGKALAFTQAEVQFLFPAPLLRPELIRYKIVRAQVSIVASSAILTIWVARSSLAAAPIVFAGLWLATTTLTLHLMGVTLTRASVVDHGVAGVSRQRIPLALVATATVIAVGTIAADWPRVAAAPTTQELAAELQRILGTGPSAVVVWPFRAVARAAIASSGTEFLRALPAALVLLVLNMVWVIRSDSAFEETAAELAEKTAQERKGQPAPAHRSGPMGTPFTLPPTGRVEIAILWKNLILVGLRARTTTIVLTMAAIVMMVIAVSRFGGVRESTGDLWLMAAVMVIFLGPMTMRSDLRRDLAHLAVFKTWPVRGAEVIRGEVLAPAIVLSLLSSALIACGAALSGGARFGFVAGSGAGQLSFAAAAILVSSALITTSFVVQNAGAVMFPAWVRIGAQAAGGVETMGQNMVVMMGSLIVLAITIIPAALAAGIAAFVINLAAGAVPIVLPAAILAAVLLLECLAATEALGRVLDGTDIESLITDR